MSAMLREASSFSSMDLDAEGIGALPVRGAPRRRKSTVERLTSSVAASFGVDVDEDAAYDGAARGQSPLAEDDGEAFCAIGEAAAMLLQSLRWFMPFGGSGPLAEQRDLGDDCASEVSGDSEAGAASHFRSGMMTAFTLPAGDSFVH